MCVSDPLLHAPFGQQPTDRLVPCVRLQFAVLQRTSTASKLSSLNVLLQVRDNVDAVLQGLGLLPSPLQQEEAAALAEVQRILRPVQGLTWLSGLPENN
jgi:hypothetical protein